MKTIVGYNPYLYVMGGGEAYFLRVMVGLKTSARVILEEPTYLPKSIGEIIEQAMRYHEIDISGIDFVKHGSIIGADLYISMHNSRFACNRTANRNISIIQVPSRFNSNKQLPDLLVFNSDFTRRHWMRMSYQHPKDTAVITPPIHAIRKDVKKEPGFDIISIGRFGEKLHCKGEERLLSIFRRLRKRLPNIAIRLHLVGTSTLLGESHNPLKSSKKDQFFIHEDISRSDLYTLLSQADFFWNSTGFGVNENESPEKVEHFGMAIAEALICGAVPVIQPKGGAAESLVAWESYIPWEQEEDLISNTLELIRNPDKLRRIRDNVNNTDWYTIFNSVSGFQEKWLAATSSTKISHNK